MSSAAALLCSIDGEFAPVAPPPQRPPSPRRTAIVPVPGAAPVAASEVEQFARALAEHDLIIHDDFVGFERRSAPRPTPRLDADPTSPVVVRTSRSGSIIAACLLSALVASGLTLMAVPSAPTSPTVARTAHASALRLTSAKVTGTVAHGGAVRGLQLESSRRAERSAQREAEQVARREARAARQVARLEARAARRASQTSGSTGIASGGAVESGGGQ